jgi:hypothetical protein
MSRVTAVLLMCVLLPFTWARAAGASDPELVLPIRAQLKTDPAAAVDRLNESLMVQLLQRKEYAAVEEFAIAGTLALPADTWRIEQLQKHRIRALLAENRPAEALRAAKGLFNACGMGFVKDELPLLCECLTAARRDDRGLVPRFKRQILAGAQEDPAERQRLLAKFGGNSIMTSIEADPTPYAQALRQRRTIGDWRGLYGTGNLLLLSGRVKEAREVFEKVYAQAPPTELRYASEAIAKLIKAEDGGLGRANEFVRSIQPKG